MEVQDHAYTHKTYDKISTLEFTYKMSSKEIEDFVKLRAANNHLFSGRRNTSMWAWRAILRHMGLQHKMTHSQAAKKWENMKKRYKELKNPPDEAKVFPEVWPYFSLMDDAMEGRLDGNAPVLKALPNDRNNSDFLPISKTKKRKVSTVVNAEVEVSLNVNEGGEEEAVHEGRQEIIMQEVEKKRNVMNGERQVIEREKQVMERERLVLLRERAVLDRDRALMERERAMIEREKAVMERERAVFERDRDAVSNERLALEREKAKLERPKENTEEIIEEFSRVKDLDAIDRKERFLTLFEKLLEKF